MLHDEDVYFDPERFFPCRFEGLDPAPDPRVLTYGFGRRYEFYLPEPSAPLIPGGYTDDVQDCILPISTYTCSSQES